MTTRRAFLGSLAGGLVAVSLAVQAQQAGTVRRTDVLGVSPLCKDKNLSLGRP